MSFTADTNQLIIWVLIFIVGLLIGVFLTAGGRRKWKSRYESEISRRRDLEKAHEEREKRWADQEKEWRERDSLRAAAVKDRRDAEDDRAL
jgi:predicted histidine transporter YuiF (NhaC family)